ncbi:PREDICTED: uncharacterized protein LOC104611189 [Nelumbo nucifera]|uniref:Tyrosine-specific transport protein-like n=2 Tax=Nelumbo nucifera TaxID=4432 RepID=A0A822YC87_NELNU|nr:PREDICTED: uncharacterized protein LOC104611189 [Nelumbo nucifera]DAD30200.1 TPA_asm: hypothetical protein HUJ06_031668 [Nelumbo nucifera]
MLLFQQSYLNPIACRLITKAHFYPHRRLFVSHSPTDPSPITKTPLSIFTRTSSTHPLILTRCKTPNSSPFPIISENDSTKLFKPQQVKEEIQDRTFWGAVSLIIGTAVGPGMLGLPSATIRSGPLPSTITILLSWVYVVSSILLVAELSFGIMEEDVVGEVSFTSLATKTLGNNLGTFVAVVYACLSFSLLVACVSGIGSLIIQWFPWMNPVITHAFFPCIVASVVGFFPFKAIDAANRFLCFIMLLSISVLVFTGLSLGRSSLLSSFAYASWVPSAILPAIPVTVLTLGFHVITPFICKIIKKMMDARKAILLGGAVPLIMVLSWNLVVLGLVGTKADYSQDPISLLLSVNPSALPAVQGFAFSALATSLIGYTVSFPKQLLDTLELIKGRTESRQLKCASEASNDGGMGKVGFAVYSRGCNLGTPGQVSFIGSRCISGSKSRQSSTGEGFSSAKFFVMLFVLGIPVFLASFFNTAFSKALDFAGIYANCFLFGILPPVMTWIYRSRKKNRSSTSEVANILPGGDGALLLLFGISIILAVWH